MGVVAPVDPFSVTNVILEALVEELHVGGDSGVDRSLMRKEYW